MATYITVMARRRILWSIVTVAAICAALCGLAGAVLCETAVHPARRPVPSNAAALTVEVTALDGIVLRAWLFKAKQSSGRSASNGDGVLILHGIADSRASLAGLASMFLDHGYTVLA